MGKKQDKEPVSLETMLGVDGGAFKGKGYDIRALPLKRVREFMGDNISVGAQLFNLADDEPRANLDKWLKECITLNGKPQGLEDLEDAGWDLVDLKTAVRKIIDLSG